MSFFRNKKYKIPQELIDELKRKIFISINDDLMPDAFNTPDENFVSVSFDKLGNGNTKFLDAVKEYIKVRDLIEAEVQKLDGDYYSLGSYVHDLTLRVQMYVWKKPYVDFVLTEEQKTDFEKWITPEFSAYCLANHVYYVFEKDRIFYDLTMGKRFKIDYEYVPGSADDAATYYDYKRVYLD